MCPFAFCHFTSALMVCPHCDDTGWKPVEDNGSHRVARCDCWRDQVGHKRLADANIPKRYRALRRSRNFIAYQRIARTRVAAGASGLPTAFLSSTRVCCSSGPPGVGKTHLAVAVLKQVMQTTGVAAMFYDTRDLLTADPQHLRLRRSGRPRWTVIRPVMEAELLVLDDLGAEKTSDWVEETMNLIVNTRYNEQRLTIFTSNYEDIPDATRHELAALPSRLTGCARGSTRCANSWRYDGRRLPGASA